MEDVLGWEDLDPPLPPATMQNGPGQLDVAGTIMYHGPFLAPR